MDIKTAKERLDGFDMDIEDMSKQCLFIETTIGILADEIKELRRLHSVAMQSLNLMRAARNYVEIAESTSPQ